MALDERPECYVCGKDVPSARGVYQADLGILTHQGKCSEITDFYRRDYSRSKRGRWRAKGTVLQMIRMYRRYA